VEKKKDGAQAGSAQTSTAECISQLPMSLAFSVDEGIECSSDETSI
jgi:hypothetical protein